MNIENINKAQQELYAHNMIAKGNIETISDLRLFMESHVFCVWDFMSLIKSLQHHVCPSTRLWIPGPYVQDGTARLINDIVLAEESDITIDGRYLSHFDMYLEAMEEVGADTLPVKTFLNNILTHGVESAINDLYKTHPTAAEFVAFTLSVVEQGSPAVIASSFAFGRETSIPEMFQGIVDTLGITKEECPMFIYYLERHIELDGEEHGPAALRLVEKLAEGNNHTIKEAEEVAIYSIQARIRFWDGVEKVINDSRPKKKETTSEVEMEKARGTLFPADAVRVYGPRF